MLISLAEYTGYVHEAVTLPELYLCAHARLIAFAMTPWAGS